MGKCKDCKYIRGLYVPPIDAYKDIPKDKFVCTLFEGEDNRVMYLEDDKGMCECFSRKKTSVKVLGEIKL